MARVPMVTRTITTTVATVKVANMEAQNLEDRQFTLPRVYKDNEAILKEVKKQDTETCKAIAVTNVTVNETLYGMTEQEFVAAAKVLPAREKNRNRSRKGGVNHERDSII